ncbi:hypothetical protein F5884DRAFT_346329 [Xylogone sp. PMI_703]|nr:hypothetical protein F5884DRAFT_346329 [Xylogone sp. PMI_703]
MPEGKLKLRRTGTPRSHGACLTCRYRKLKCDEEKPACRRCTSTGRVCDGYPKKFKGRHDGAPAVLLPKRETATENRLLKKGPSLVLMSESEVENRYFRHFYARVTSGIEGALDWVLWNRIVPQTSHNEQFVRQCIVAIGALVKSQEVAHSLAPANPPDPLVAPLAKLHFDFALMKYDKAVRNMQEAISSSTNNPRQVLIGCLLVVCFEMFLGNRHVAMAHAESGTIILHQWLTQLQNERSKNVKMLSPSPATVEDEIVDAFQNLDIQITGISDHRSDKVHRGLMDEHLGTVQHIPPTFSDLREARVFLNIVSRRICHFLATTWSPSKAQELARDFEGPTPGGVSVMTGVNIYSTSFKLTDDICIQQKRFAKEISDWSRTFAPLFKSTCKSSPPGSRAYNLAVRLRILAIATTILCAGVVITNEIEYDDFNPLFRELIDLIKIVVTPHWNSPLLSTDVFYSGFHLDIGVTAHLFLIVLRCRDRKIRREAIEVLGKWQIEGCWDPGLIREIGIFMMEVEEEGVDWNVHKVIPENKRAIFSKINENPWKRKGILQCVQKTGGEDGGPVWKEKLISW